MICMCGMFFVKTYIFDSNKGIVSRLDQPKLKQTPWTKFTLVEWDSKTFKAGQMVSENLKE